MKYGICNLSIVPVRESSNDASEMVTQILYGEHFKILDSKKKWSRIRIAFDNYEGWIDNKQLVEITEDQYAAINSERTILSSDLIDFVTNEKEELISIPVGSSVHACMRLGHKHEGHVISNKQPKLSLITNAILFLNAPYLWGGKTPFGIDCSGLTQMVYKLSGYSISRDASQQATLGEALSFIEETESGDLAFFDNDEGVITHVGIIMEDNYIIHAHGKVRIDRLDHTGIFNCDLGIYSHKLRVLKKII